jgi:hypothetical protein
MNDLFVNKLGAGTKTPAGTLDVYGKLFVTHTDGIEIDVASGDPKIIFDTDGADKFCIGVDDDDGDKLEICAGAAIGTNVRVAISAVGFGIETATPDELLHVNTAVAGEGAHIGNAFVGVWDTSNSFAVFVHNTVKATAGSYALLQAFDGTTYLNAASGKTLFLRINNADLMTLAGTTVTIGSAGVGDLWVGNNCSALSFTDRTPHFIGDALAAIRGIRGDTAGIDHRTLPEFARARIAGPGGKVEDGRNLSAIVSLLTIAVQQLLSRVERLEA